MPEAILEQPENQASPEAMMDVFSPQGTKGKVPSAQWPDYHTQGFKAAVRVTSPSGTAGWLPNDKVAEYTQKHGFKIGPPEQQKLGGESVVKPGPKSGVSMNAPISSTLSGIAGGLGVPESEHPIRDFAESTQIIKPDTTLGAVAGPLLNPMLYAAKTGAGIYDASKRHIQQGIQDLRDANVSSDVIKSASEIQQPNKLDAKNDAFIKIAHGRTWQQLSPTEQRLVELNAEAAIRNPTDKTNYPLVARGITHIGAGAFPVIGPAAYEAGAEAGEGIANKDVDQALHGGGKGIGLLGGLLLGTEKGQAATEAMVPKITRPVLSTAEKALDITRSGVQNVKTAINPIGNMTAGELATKAIRPRNSKVNFPAELETALPDTKRALQNAGVDQGNMTLHDVLDAATQAKKDVWAEYQQNHSGPAGQLQIDTTPIADAMLTKITPRMRTQQPGLVKQIEANAAEYSGKSMAAQDLEARVGEANNETRGIEAKYLTDKNAAKLDPNNAALFAERDTARQLLLNKLDEATGPGAADLRKRYGNLNSFQDVVSRRIPVADRAAPMGLPQILAKMYGPGKILGGLAQVATGVGAPHGVANIIEGGASMIGAKNARLMNDPDALIQHAFSKTEATPAARPYVAPPQPAIRGLLDEGPIITPPPADTSGSVPFSPPPIATTSRAQRMGLMLPERTAIEAPPVPPQGREGLLPAASRIDENGRMQYLTSPAEPGTQRAPIARPNQQQTATPVPLRPTEPPQGAPAAQQAITERRVNPIQRKLVSEMSPEERANTLLTSDVVDLPNRRAFNEAGPAKAVAMSDADGLKAFNDKFGYDAGNELLKAKAEALKEAGLDAYHDKGDEFLGRGESEADLKQKYEKAREILRNREIEVTQADGTVRIFKGADFSYGTGKDLAAAEKGLKANKASREASGERARGELRGIVEVGPKTGEENPGAAAAPRPIARPPK